MTKANQDYKLIGNCPICGNRQAVNGGMSKHGYTVTHGWFSGVCYGEGKPAMQQDKTATLKMVDGVKAQILELESDIAKLQSGKMKPKTAPIASHYKAEEVPFDQAPEWSQKNRVESIIRNLQFKIKSGQNHITYMMDLLEKVYGTELLKEIKKPAPAQIMTGEKRILRDRVVTCKSVEGQRIYYKDERGFGSYTSPAAWRKLQTA
jgi:hypothetical protein